MPTTSIPSDPRHASWQAALDRLELDVVRTEQALDGDGIDPLSLDLWNPPETTGPMPTTLRERAQALVDRQRQVMRRVAEQLGVTAARRAYADDAARSSRATGPVYVDARY